MIDNYCRKVTDESFACNVNRCLVLCDVLANADIRRVSPYIAYKYGEKFNTAWKDNPDLIKKFYQLHKPELYAYNSYMLTEMVNHLVSMLSSLNYHPTIPLDAATANCLDNLVKELNNDADSVELQQVLTTNMQDVLAGKTFIRRPIFSKFELLNQIACANIEIDKDIRIGCNGLDRHGPYLFSKLLSDACIKILRNINARIGQTPTFHAWGVVLGAIYKLHVDNEWLYSNGYGRYYRQCEEKRGLEPYYRMNLEDVLVGPNETVDVIPDERLFKITQCKYAAVKPENELIKKYVNLFYHVKQNDTNSTYSNQLC